ncbi:DNA polymerase III subunit beta [Candidatus Saccharibacteria bacterium]|nr:DNA polymerase III subunit beta [Candidatus Saccharibacteria bacterium]MBQ3467971.1 DNA polymerase III subunit beta [Candidatus Saccharibacteria bacterium]
MEIEVTQEKLAKALASVSRVAAGARATLPILSNVLIRADKNKVSLVATNLDMAVVEYVPVISAKDGVVTVPAKIIAEFVNNLPKGEKISLKTEGVKVKISAGKYESVINGAMADDFPELPEIDEKKVVKYKMPADEFKVGVSEIIIATSNDTTRPALTGVYFNTDGGNLYIAATDGYRLAEKEFIKKVSSEVKAIVPAASLQEVLRSMSDDIEEVEIVFDESQVRFRMGEMEITSKLIDGTYPNYRSLIPEKTKIEVVIDKTEFLRITKMAAIFSREVNQSIVCETDAEKKVFAISSILNEAGENRSEVKVQVEESGKVRVDSRYLMAALNALEEPMVRFGMSAENLPVLIRNEKSNKYRHIVVPADI